MLGQKLSSFLLFWKIEDTLISFWNFLTFKDRRDLLCMIGQSFFSEGDLKIFTNLIWEWDEPVAGKIEIDVLENEKKNPPELKKFRIIWFFLILL